jgi:hypothetical protein
MKPGEIITCKIKDFIHANEHLETIFLKVSNVGGQANSGGKSYAFF